MAAPTAVSACVFDAYGTLLDVGSAVAAEAAALGPRADELSALWRRKQLEYTWLRSLMRPACRFLAGDARMRSTTRWQRWRCRDGELRQRLLAAYRVLGGLSDVVPALAGAARRRAADRHPVQRQPRHAADAVAAAGIADLLDPVLSVERSACSSRPRRSIVWPSTGSAARRRRSSFSPATAGTCTVPRRSASSSIWVNRAGCRTSACPARPCGDRGPRVAADAARARRRPDPAGGCRDRRRCRSASPTSRRRPNGCAGSRSQTPLLESEALNALVGGRLLIKAEPLQRTGSFKFRGAYNAISVLRPAAVVAYSSGNHAQGVALAARLLGIPATIVMPADAPRTKLEGTRALGAEVVTYDRASDDREAIGREIAARTGAVLIRPYDDPLIMAGQGTLGLELAEQAAAPRGRAGCGAGLLRRRRSGRRLRPGA